jgi:SAM-dependent methyltransferase
MSDMVIQHLISAACEQRLRLYGDNFRGVGYTKSEQEASERYALMLDVVHEKEEPISLLDFGCGLGHLRDHLARDRTHPNIRYVGLDISGHYLELARMRNPECEFIQMDVLECDAELAEYDYIVLNGLFNYRGKISETDMLDYWRRLTAVLYKHCKRGMAFNVMSKIVDWEREDLFHLGFDTMATFVSRALSRYFIIRHDYRAYEYIVYVYRNPM